MQDSNWLLSSAAQAAAALVAIVGGFLVSRLTALALERRALSHELEDSGRRLAAVKKEAGHAQRRLLEQDAFDFLDAARSDVATDTDLPMASYRSYRALDELEPFWKWAKSVACRLRSGGGLPSHSPFVTMEVDWLGERIREAVMDHDKPVSGYIVSAMKPSQTAAIERLDENIAYRQLMDRADRLDAEVHQLGEDIRVSEARLGALREVSPEIQHGLYMLVYFGLVGVAVPLATLAYEPAHLSTPIRWVIWGLFMTGLIGLFTYVADLISGMAASEEAPDGAGESTALNDDS